jgi:hypothetical protein
MKQELPLFEQPLFRSIVVGGTGLGLGLMIGSLALIRGRDAAGFVWGWSWWSLILFAAGAWFTGSFWKAVFKAGDEPSHKNKTRVVFYLFLLAALGLGSFLYPLRFMGSENYYAVAKGLFTAFLFLGGVGALLYKVGGALIAQSEKAEKLS